MRRNSDVMALGGKGRIGQSLLGKRCPKVFFLSIEWREDVKKAVRDKNMKYIYENED